MEKIRCQRVRTKKLATFERVEAFVESASHKAKRIVGAVGKHRRHSSLDSVTAFSYMKKDMLELSDRTAATDSSMLESSLMLP